MQVDPDDALQHYGHNRAAVAALDARIEAIGLKAHCAGHGAPLDAEALRDAQALLSELVQAVRSFASAAEELATSLEPDS